jgi:hypothetical protein
LNRISLSEIGTRLQPDEFLRLFRALSRLEAIELNLGVDFSKSDLITGDFLLHLSQMPKLKYLEISNSLDQPDFFQMIRDENDNPFQSLTKVVLPVGAHPVSLCFLIICATRFSTSREGVRICFTDHTLGHIWCHVRCGSCIAKRREALSGAQGW